MMFIGEFDFLLDERNTCQIPTDFRRELTEAVMNGVVMVKSPDGYLVVYPKERWDALLKTWEELPSADGMLPWASIFTSKTIKIEKSWEIYIPEEFRKHANIKKELVVVGCGDYLEIWDAERWQKEKIEAQKTFEELEGITTSSKIYSHFLGGEESLKAS